MQWVKNDNSDMIFKYELSQMQNAKVVAKKRKKLKFGGFLNIDLFMTMFYNKKALSDKTLFCYNEL